MVDGDEAAVVELVDARKLAALMLLGGVSARAVARAAGWSSHRYVLRLLDGERTGVRVEAAVRIAERLGVAVDELFVPRSTRIAGRDDRQAVAG